MKEPSAKQKEASNTRQKAPLHESINFLHEGT
jgi:hypothetical protein